MHATACTMYSITVIMTSKIPGGIVSSISVWEMIPLRWSQRLWLCQDVKKEVSSLSCKWKLMILACHKIIYQRRRDFFCMKIVPLWIVTTPYDLLHLNSFPFAEIFLNVCNAKMCCIFSCFPNLAFLQFYHYTCQLQTNVQLKGKFNVYLQVLLP